MIFESTSVFAAVSQPNKTLKIDIDHADRQNLTVAGIHTEDLPPEDYKVSFMDNYYNLQILDSSDSIVFSGQTKSRIFQPPPDSLLETPPDRGIVEIHDPVMTLNLPYFSEAKKVRILDEKNILLLEINLALYEIPDSTMQYGECDSCGFCKSQKKIPQDWEKCRVCIYSAASRDPQSGDTIRIYSGIQVTPEPGHSYTGIGCISSAGFTTESGKAGVTRAILNVIMGLTGGLALIFLLYSAFLIATAKGEKKQIQRGKTIFIRTFIGVIIVFSAVFLVNLIASGILKIPEFK